MAYVLSLTIDFLSILVLKKKRERKKNQTPKSRVSNAKNKFPNPIFFDTVARAYCSSCITKKFPCKSFTSHAFTTFPDVVRNQYTKSITHNYIDDL